jgi:hypothetical protein
MWRELSDSSTVACEMFISDLTINKPKHEDEVKENLKYSKKSKPCCVQLMHINSSALVRSMYCVVWQI